MRRAILIVFLLVSLFCSTGFVGWLGPGARTNTGGGNGNLPTPPAPPTILFGNNGVAAFATASSQADIAINGVGQVTLQLGTSTCSANCNITTTSTICNAASVPVTLLLPPAAAGLIVHVNSATTSANACKLMAQGIDLIGTSATLNMPNAQDDVILIGLASGQWGIAHFTYPVPQTAPANQFVTGVTNGVISSGQPACSGISGAAAHCGTNASELNSGTVPTAQLPNPLPAANIPAPSASTLGGINSAAAVSHKWINSIGTNGQISQTQPASTDLSDLPLPISSGGTAHTTAGCATANGLGAACSGNNVDITQLGAFVGPITLSQGGTNCPTGPVNFANLPASPVAGETCYVKDPQACAVQLGVAVVNGGGSCGNQTWPVTFNGLSNCGNGSQNCWMGGGNAALPAGAGPVPINQLPSQTAAYNANAQKLANVACPSLANDVLAQACAASVTAATATTSMTTPFLQTNASNPAVSGLVRAANNTTIEAGRNAGNTADIPVGGTDASNNVVIGGPAANGISLNNSSTVNQGAMQSGQFVDVPTVNAAWMGSTDNCTTSWHDYTVVANGSAVTFNCPATSTIKHLYYRIHQPAAGATFTYLFSAGAGGTVYTPLGGPLPPPCNTNSCFDDYDVIADGVYGQFRVQYDGTYSPLSSTPTSACPSGQTCYFFDVNAGNDTNACTQLSPCKTIGKALTKLSSLNPGDELLFQGGETWTGDGGASTCASNCEPPFYFGDVAAHNVQGSASNPIVVGTYGAGAAILDENNVNPYCFAALSGTTSVKNLTIQNFECKHAWWQGVTFQDYTSPGSMPGITVQNMYIHDTGPGCAAAGGACYTGVDGVPAWSTGSHPGRTYIQPTSNNAGNYVFSNGANTCTSGGSQPGSWNQSPGGTTTDGGCTWTNTGVLGGYINQLDFETTTGVDAVRFLNNTVKWEGGHNCVQDHLDHGAALIQGNTAGPGCVHNTFDVKSVGSATNQVVVRGNVCVGGVAEGEQTGACYYGDDQFNANFNVLFQSNVAYDAGVTLQISPAGGPSSVCAGTVKIYNNTFYAAAAGAQNNVYLQNATNCVNGFAGIAVDLRNNIIDGGAVNSLVINASGGTQAYSSCIEDYNDAGGAQGLGGVWFTCNGGSSLAAHDFNATNPNYVNASIGNFTLQPNSPVDCPTGGTANGPCAGLTGLTVNNPDMGAF